VSPWKTRVHAVVVAALTVLSGAVCTLAAAERAEAAWPGADGLVVFVDQTVDPEDGDRSTGLRSFTMGRPETLSQLTTDPSDRSPQISPDGGQIVFQREIGGSSLGFTRSAIFLVGSDGQAPRQVTQPLEGESDTEPAFDPSGQRIVFARRNYRKDEGGDIYSVALDGSDLRQLTRGPAADGNPAASPTGRQIVFERTRYRLSCRCDLEHIFSMRPDGTRVRNLTPGRRRDAHSPDFSPDGQRIVYSAGYLQFASVFMMRANGSHLRQIVGRHEDRTGSTEPVFSPSGDGLLGVAVDVYGSALERIRFVGGAARFASLNTFRGISPAWGPAPR
jgi:WD40-like Beta Propeller Repeat